jgi:hypothetical protein
MNLMRIIRVSAVVVGLGFVTLVPRVCHAQAEVNPDFYDDQPLTPAGTSVAHHGVTKLTPSSFVASAHPECKDGAVKKSGCSATQVPVRTRRTNPLPNARASHRSSATPTTTISSKADAQTAQRSAGG